MENEQPASEEFVLKEYPKYTQWIEGKKVSGVGNLILTTERLIFLHGLPLDEEDLTRLKKMSEKTTTSRMLDIACSLYDENFQVRLSSIDSVKTGLYSPLPFPRFCLRIDYTSKKKSNRLTFMFTIPLWKGLFQLEITTVIAWSKYIRTAMKHKQSAAPAGR